MFYCKAIWTTLKIDLCLKQYRSVIFICIEVVLYYYRCEKWILRIVKQSVITSHMFYCISVFVTTYSHTHWQNSNKSPLFIFTVNHRDLLPATKFVPQNCFLLLIKITVIFIDSWKKFSGGKFNGREQVPVSKPYPKAKIPLHKLINKLKVKYLNH
jgi:hypothetical protein